MGSSAPRAGNLVQFAGDYEVSPPRNLPLSQHALWSIATGDDTTKCKPGDHVVVSLDESDQLKASLMRGNVQIAERPMQGEFHDGYFFLHPYMKFYTLWFLLNGIRDGQAALAIGNDGQLIVDQNSEGTFFVLLAPVFSAGASTEDHYNHHEQHR